MRWSPTTSTCWVAITMPEFVSTPDDVRVEGVATWSDPLFIGIAPADAVAGYFDGVVHDEITEWDSFNDHYSSSRTRSALDVVRSLRSAHHVAWQIVGRVDAYRRATMNEVDWSHPPPTCERSVAISEPHGGANCGWFSFENYRSWRTKRTRCSL